MAKAAVHQARQLKPEITERKSEEPRGLPVYMFSQSALPSATSAK
jgi:hypothetical protein